MKDAIKGTAISVSEFTVAPQVNPDQGLPYHEWFIEFETPVVNLPEIAEKLDTVLQSQNSYYKDLLDGNMLQQLKISPLQKGAFQEYMKSQGKLGGQNKVPRLSNDRNIADKLATFILKNPTK